MVFETDDELLKGCLKGSRKAQQSLYNKYGGQLFGVCLRYLKNTMDAEEAFQDGFVKIFKNMNKFEQRGAHSLFFWMKRIMSNTCLNYLRDSKKPGEFLDLHAGYEFEDIQTDEMSLIDVFEHIHPEEIRQIICNLPDGYRTVFNMYAFEEYTHAEIAEILQISVSTSKTQLMKARKTIVAAMNMKISQNGHKTNNNIRKYETT